MPNHPSLISLMARATRLYRAVLNDLLVKHNIDLSSEMLGVLVELWQNEGLSHQELSQRLKKDKGGMTKLINSLEYRHLIVRQPDAEDARRKRVFLTTKGRSLSQHVQPLVHKLRQFTLGDIPTEQQVQTQETLAKIITNLETKKGA